MCAGLQCLTTIRKDKMLALGLMTGTALDGFIDAALIRTNGTEIEALGGWLLHPYDAKFRARFAAAVSAARHWEFRGQEPEEFLSVERDYTLALAGAVRALLSQEGVKPSDVEVIGMHGLTMLHRPTPRPGKTRQLGDGNLLARELGIDVAYDFRTADLLAGGQGAPLAPIYHAALLRWSKREAPAAVLNLGGVANITSWAGEDNIIAFDTGPANGPLNEWMERHTGATYDKDGACAAAGRVDEALLRHLLQRPYFSEDFPKSLDRFDFNAGLVEQLNLEDGAATLTALSAAGIARGVTLLPSAPREFIVCGGGRKNPTLMSEIEKRTGKRAIDCDTIGWRGDAVEAEVFAYLAARRVKGFPISFPTTTGVSHPMPGGRVARA